MLDNRREVLVQDTCEHVYAIDLTCGRKTKRCAPSSASPSCCALASLNDGHHRPSADDGRRVLASGLLLMNRASPCVLQTQRCADSFGRVDFDETRKELEQRVSVPTWCSVDCKIGSLSVKLDFPQVVCILCLSCLAFFVLRAHSLLAHAAPALLMARAHTGVRMRGLRLGRWFPERPRL